MSDKPSCDNCFWGEVHDPGDDENKCWCYYFDDAPKGLKFCQLWKKEEEIEGEEE